MRDPREGTWEADPLFLAWQKKAAGAAGAAAGAAATAAGAATVTQAAERDVIPAATVALAGGLSASHLSGL
jgi:hypothetical protein